MKTIGPNAVVAQKRNATDLLTTILNQPEQARELPPEAIPALLVQLAATQTMLAAQLFETAAAAEAGRGGTGGRLLTVEEAAQKLGIAQDWLYRRAGSLPFTVRLGRSLRFSETGIDRWIRSRSGR